MENTRAQDGKWIREIVIALAVIMFVCYLGILFLQTVHQENICWRNGYETPINYLGECYCFGRDGQPDIAKLSDLEARETSSTEASKSAVSSTH